MNNQTTAAADALISNLFTLHLADGIPAHTMQGGQKVPFAYKEVRLRETNVADQRWAVQQSERAILVNGSYQLLSSQSDYQLALTLRHCEMFLHGEQALPTGAVDLELFGKLSDHDLALIQERIYLIELAAQVRYGALDDVTYKTIVTDHVEGKIAGKMSKSSPQSTGQAPAMAATAADVELGPAMLADYAGARAHGAAAGLGGGFAAQTTKNVA